MRDYLLIEVLYETGCTVSELVELTRKDIGADGIAVSGRRCLVSQNLLARIREFLRSHDSQYVFPSRQRSSMTPKRVQQIIKSYLERLDAGLEKTSPHLLRYTHIAHAVQQHIPLPAIMKQTGLGELRLSQIVSEVAPQEQSAYGRMFS